MSEKGAVHASGILTTDRQARKEMPICRGVLDYFSAAIAAVSNVSHVGNVQHNPGEEMHWARGKSTDHADCIVRHLIERGGVDTDGIRHSAKLAWRALALLQEELEKAGAAPSRGSRFPPQPEPNKTEPAGGLVRPATESKAWDMFSKP